jgi:ABC-type phosphate/phosphonate transport system substrate-binding protein
MRFRPLPVVVLMTCCLNMTIEAQSSRSPVPFFGLPLDNDTVEADRSLADYLRARLDRPVDPNNSFKTYEELIETLTGRSDAYIARMTPYSYIAARMLGAEFNVLATYVSVATSKPTYRSYLVINRERFGTHDRTLDGVRRFLEEKSVTAPARFIFHDEFSTSSYFVPALWFRDHHIFATEQSLQGVVRVRAAKESRARSSTELVRIVASGGADLAAVWDGTKAKFEGGDADLTQEFGNKLTFIPLPNLLPNDLLVASTALDEDTRERIVNAIEVMKDGAIKKGDFDSWRPIINTPDALSALAALTRDATAPPAPVVVAVAPANPESVPYVDQVRRAVRLAGTEFVLEVPKFHARPDIEWTVRKVHDGAVQLSTVMVEPELNHIKQSFQLSFTAAEGDLTRRVVSLMHSRMHRIRYIWPYKAAQPTVIRDVDFTVPPDSVLRVHRLTWRDPDRNDFVPDKAFDVRVGTADDYKFGLDKESFAAGGAMDFQDPLSNVAYRVVLRRDPIESTLSKVLTGTFVGLLVLTAAGATFDLRRRTRPAPPPGRQTLREVCAAKASAQHQVWRGRTLTDADVLWCERQRVEHWIANYKQEGLIPAAMGGITTLTSRMGVGVNLPLIGGILSGGAGIDRLTQLIVDPEKVSDAVRFGALLNLLLRKRLLASFIGRPLEWDALNDLARDVLGLPAADAARLVNAENPNIVDIASRDFNLMIEEGMARLCFFPGSWTVTTENERRFARQHVTLPGELWFRSDDSRISSLMLEFDLPDGAVEFAGTTFDCWIAGTIVRANLTRESGVALYLHFRPVALLSPQSLARTEASNLANRAGDTSGKTVHGRA